MVGLESKWDLTREDMIFVLLGAADKLSDRTLGFEGRRPRRPLRLSVLTTSERGKKLSCTRQLLHLRHSQFLCHCFFEARVTVVYQYRLCLLNDCSSKLMVLSPSYVTATYSLKYRTDCGPQDQKKIKIEFFSNSRIKFQF